MRVPELDELIIEVINRADHPEILRAAPALAPGDVATKHTRVKVDFASGARVYVQVYKVTGPKIPRADNYAVPKEAL